MFENICIFHLFVYISDDMRHSRFCLLLFHLCMQIILCYSTKHLEVSPTIAIELHTAATPSQLSIILESLNLMCDDRWCLDWLRYHLKFICPLLGTTLARLSTKPRYALSDFSKFEQFGTAIPIPDVDDGFDGRCRWSPGAATF